MRLLTLLLPILLSLSLIAANPLHPAAQRSELDGAGLLPRAELLAPAPRTNAERLARGLPPAAPRALFAATRTRRQAPSPLPVAGLLQMRTLDGSVYGYVAAAMNSGRAFSRASDPSAALSVSFAAPADGSVFDITQLNTGSSHPYLGAAVGPASTSSNLLPGSFNYALLTTTEQTPAGSPPATDANALGSYPAESCLWTYSATTGQLSPHWVNTDGSQPATYIVYRSSSNVISLTGDVVAFGSAFPGPVQLNFFVV